MVALPDGRNTSAHESRKQQGSLAALLGTSLIGSAAVVLVPIAAQAQWHRDWDDRDYRADRDRSAYHRDWDDRYYRDRDDRFGVGVRFGGVGIGVYGYPDYYPYYSGCSYNPYYCDSGPYCSDYDYEYGCCTY